MSALPRIAPNSVGIPRPEVSTRFRHVNRVGAQIADGKRIVGKRDRELVMRLQRRFTGVPGLTVHHIHEALAGKLTIEEIDEVLNDALDAMTRRHAALLADVRGAVMADTDFARQCEMEQREGW